MYIWFCSCPVSGQILSVFTAPPFPLPSFHLCVFFTLPVLPGSHCLCQCISHEQFLPSFLSKQLLPLCAIPPPCCILSAGGCIKIRTFCRAFLGSLYYFFSPLSKSFVPCSSWHFASTMQTGTFVISLSASLSEDNDLKYKTLQTVWNTSSPSGVETRYSYK